MSSPVISSSSQSITSEKEDRGSHSTRIVCTAHGCNQTFSNVNELTVHKQKHQMTLKLGPSRSGLADMLPFDQTPTPTKFLQYGKEMGLFDEISNPFDSEFKRNTSSGQSLKEKARLSSVPGLIINNLARTPTSYPQTLASIGQPVHVITLTPTLPSPVMPGGSFFLPPLPSPQGFLPSPAALISPSIVPFSAPGLPFPTVQAVVEAQQAALTQAFISAAAVAANPHQTTLSHHGEVSSTTSHGHLVASRASSITDLPNRATPPFPTQNVSVPVNNNPTPPSCHSVGQNMASAPVGSASVIQQHGQANIEQQRRRLTQSNSHDHPSHPANMERKPSFHGETSVITQAPAHSSTAAHLNANINPHSVSSSGFHYMQNNVPPFSHLAADVTGIMQSHPVLTASRSVPTTIQHNLQSHPHPLPHQNSLPNIDAKQKLKETLTNNNPNLQSKITASQQQFVMRDEEKNMNEVTSSSGNDGKTTGRRRGRQSEIDPDRKRMRFLERNRAAASRCRAKKKQWVCGLEYKANELSSSNVNLQNEVATLREEVASLKQLLLAHRDCPITRLQQHKIAISGGDPMAVVSNPVQAAASLLGISKEENGDCNSNNNKNLLPPTEEDVKPNTDSLLFSRVSTSSDGSIGDASDASIQMQTSVLVNANHACKTEKMTERFPAVLPQSTNASAIVMNNNYNATLSATSST